jgi:hypothetical protein
MATDKLFTVAGTSRHPEHGFKVRFANDVMRVKNLAKSGHEDITLIELPEAMDKISAAKFIQSLDEFQGSNEQAAIDDYLDRNTETPKVTVEIKTPKAKTSKAKKESAPVVDEADEDKPIGYAELEDAVGSAPF